MFVHLTKIFIHANYCWLQTQHNCISCISYIHSFGVELALLLFCSTHALMDKTLSLENMIKYFLSLHQVKIFSCRWMSMSAVVTMMNQVYKLDESGLTLASKILNSSLTRSPSIRHGLPSDQPLHHWPALWIPLPPWSYPAAQAQNCHQEHFERFEAKQEETRM